jgi:hypothetical protein
MKYLDTDIVAEVRKIREALFAEYGSITAYNKHIDDERPRLEQEGWYFGTPEESQARNKRGFCPCIR